MRRLIDIFVLFVLVYGPVVKGINIMFYTLPLIYFYLFLNNHLVFKALRNRRLISPIMILGIILLSLFTNAFFRGNSLSTIGIFLFQLAITLPTALFLGIRLNLRTKPLLVSLVEDLGLVAIFQGIIAFVSFLVPSVHSFFVQQLLSTGYSKVIVSLAGHRLYGFADNLTYSTPALQAIIAILMIYHAKHIKKSYLLGLPFILFSAFMNARTSLVIFAVGVMLLLLLHTKNIFLSIFNWMVLIVSTVIFLTSEALRYTGKNVTVRWVVTGISEIILWLSGRGTTGYFDYITNANKYVLPSSNMALFFGYGRRIMQGNNIWQVKSDVGFINDIWYGGYNYLVWTTLFWVVILLALHKCLSHFNLEKKAFIPLYFLVVIVLMDFKGIIFSFNAIFNLILIVFFVLIVNEWKGNSINESKDFSHRPGL